MTRQDLETLVQAEGFSRLSAGELDGDTAVEINLRNVAQSSSTQSPSLFSVQSTSKTKRTGPCSGSPLCEFIAVMSDLEMHAVATITFLVQFVQSRLPVDTLGGNAQGLSAVLLTHSVCILTALTLTSAMTSGCSLDYLHFEPCLLEYPPQCFDSVLCF